MNGGGHPLLHAGQGDHEAIVAEHYCNPLCMGLNRGAAVCQKLLIFREAAGGHREVIGEAEITEVTEKTSRARLAGDAKPVAPGLKALEKM